MTLRLRKLVSALANGADDHAPSRSLMLQMPLRFSHHPNKDIWQLTPRGWQQTFAPKSSQPSPSGSVLPNSQPSQFLQPAELPAASLPPHGFAGRLHLRRIETVMQRMELSLLTRLPGSQRNLITEGQPVILEITVNEAKQAGVG